MEERQFYEGAVYRPPVEANSLIVQVTIGCSHNKCTFCSMYRDEQFRIKPLQRVLDDFAYARKYIRYIPSVFLADGDALIRKTSDLLAILDYIRKYIPESERVTCYASPNSLVYNNAGYKEDMGEDAIAVLYPGLENFAETYNKVAFRNLNQEMLAYQSTLWEKVKIN